MAHYLVEASYTTTSWSTQVERPANAADRIRPLVEACGGTLQCLYYAFGERDVIGIADFPTPEAAGAFGLVIAASGATATFRTTPLMSIDQGLESLRLAGEVRARYTPPVTVRMPDQPMPVT